MIDRDGIRQRYAALSSILDERGRRLLVAAEAKAAGYGGIAAVWRATGVATSTIGRGLRELAEAPALTAGRVRRAGGGRKPAVAADPDLMRDLKALVEPTARGDPEGPLRWTCKSLRRLADALQAQGHRISRTLVGELLHGLGFSLQANAKTHAGLSHPDRDAQFAFIDAKVKTALAAGDLGGRQEEGACGRRQERRAGVASQGIARSGAGARLPDQGAGAGGAVRRL